MTRQEKDITETDDKFVPAAEIEVEMAIVKKEMTGAKSEIGEVSDEPAAETPAAAAEATGKQLGLRRQRFAVEAKSGGVGRRLRPRQPFGLSLSLERRADVLDDRRLGQRDHSFGTAGMPKLGGDGDPALQTFECGVRDSEGRS